MPTYDDILGVASVVFYVFGHPPRGLLYVINLAPRIWCAVVVVVAAAVVVAADGGGIILVVALVVNDCN